MAEFPYSNAFAYVSQVASQLRRDRIYDTDYALSQDSEWYSKLRKDAIASFLTRFRCQLVAGTNWGCEGSTESPQDKRAASIVEALLKHVGSFKQARELLALGFLRGTTWARIGGELRFVDLPGLGTYRCWVATQLRDADKRRFDYRRMPGPALEHRWFFSGAEYGSTTGWQEVNPKHWVRHVYQADEGSLGWGRGLAEAMYFLMVFKTEAMSRGMNFLERWSGGMLVAAIDQLQIAPLDTDSAARAQAWLDLLEKMRSQHVAVHGAQDRIELVEGSRLGWSTVQEAIDYCDNALSRLILGAVLPTGGGSDTGSYARAAVESDSTAALVASDRELLGEAITRSLVTLLWEANYPLLRSLGLGVANMPRFVIRHVEEHDPAERASTAATLIGAGMGRWMKPAEVVQAAGFTVPGPGEETIGAEVEVSAEAGPVKAKGKTPLAREKVTLGGFGEIEGAMDLPRPVEKVGAA